MFWWLVSELWEWPSLQLRTTGCGTINQVPLEIIRLTLFSFPVVIYCPAGYEPNDITEFLRECLKVSNDQFVQSNNKSIMKSNSISRNPYHVAEPYYVQWSINIFELINCVSGVVNHMWTVEAGDTCC